MINYYLILFVVIIVITVRQIFISKHISELSKSIEQSLIDNEFKNRLNRDITEYSEDELKIAQEIINKVLHFKEIVGPRLGKSVLQTELKRLQNWYNNILFLIDELKP